MKAFSEEALLEVEQAMANYNSRYPDTLVFLAEYLANTTLASVEFAEIEAEGVWLRDPSTGDGVKLASHCLITDALSFQNAFGQWLKEARRNAGPDVPLHKLERDNNKRANLKTYITSVARMRMITPLIKEITFEGGLDEFESKGGDQFLYVMVPQPGHESAISNDFSMSQLRSIDASKRPLAAYYTVKSWHRDSRELVMWFVLHDKQHGLSGWAYSARPGDRAAVWGPRVLYAPPATSERIVLIGDETVLPAISVILAEMNPGRQAAVFVEVEDRSQELPLRNADSVEMTWIHRGGSGFNEELIAHVKQQSFRSTDYIYGGGESTKIAELSRHLRKTLKLSAPHIHLVGYWK